ncbi:MAG: hypothetical protein ACREC0_03935 [Methylocella sp.]
MVQVGFSRRHKWAPAELKRLATAWNANAEVAQLATRFRVSYQTTRSIRTAAAARWRVIGAKGKKFKMVDQALTIRFNTDLAGAQRSIAQFATDTAGNLPRVAQGYSRRAQHARILRNPAISVRLK